MDKRVRDQILGVKLELWKNTVYDATIDTKIGALVANKELEVGAQKRLKEAIKAVDFLEKELKTSAQELDEVIEDLPGES